MRGLVHCLDVQMRISKKIYSMVARTRWRLTEDAYAGGYLLDCEQCTLSSMGVYLTGRRRLIGALSITFLPYTPASLSSSNHLTASAHLTTAIMSDTAGCRILVISPSATRALQFVERMHQSCIASSSRIQ